MAELPSVQPAERYIPNAPTVHPDPVNDLGARDCCGNCPGWKQANPRAPFGQCLPAIKWLGGPMYTPDFSGCSLDMAMKEKGQNR